MPGKITTTTSVSATLKPSLSSFFGVYAMAVDTLFLCFLEDLERNDGSQQRPYYMSSGLKKILGKMEETAAEARFRSPQ